MKCARFDCAKVVFGSFNTVYFACGFLQVISGFVLLSDSRRVLLSRLLADPDSALQQPPFYYVGLALLAAGVCSCAVAALGCWATYMPGYVILTMYFLLVSCALGAWCAVGAVSALWRRCAGLHNAHGGPQGALHAYYGLSDYEHFTAAVDLAQTELHCCGMSDGGDYSSSGWQLRRLGPRGLRLPLSCCAQSAADHLSPRPLNLTRCQDIAPQPAFRHLQGCLDKLEDWYQQHLLVFLLAVFVVAVFKLGILMTTVYSCVRLRKRRRIARNFLVKSIDNNRNENIYGHNTGPMPDEPITAKYIQPNNFYSPRVRNPHIFYNKPNEMI